MIFKRRAIYRPSDGWVLGSCACCGHLNYVEPHGTTTECSKCHRETEHENIPYSFRDGMFVVRDPRGGTHFPIPKANGEPPMISTRVPRRKTASANEDCTAARSAEGGSGKVIPSRRWKHKQTGATASLYGAGPWTGAPGNREEDWRLEEVGWTISWPDGTIGIGRPPFESKGEAEKWMEEHSRFPGMGGY